MKLSTRGRYGIHAMFDLALQYSSGIPQPTKAIAERERIPDAYLEQLIATLRKAGLVTSVRGAQGGPAAPSHHRGRDFARDGGGTRQRGLPGRGERLR